MLEMLSKRFRFIWAFEKLCLRPSNLFRRTYILPNISSTLSPSFMLKD